MRRFFLFLALLCAVAAQCQTVVVHYWFDHDYAGCDSALCDTAHTQLLLDVGQLRDGLHTLNMQLGEGAAAELRNYIFFKQTQLDSSTFSLHYDCWFDQDYAARQSGTLGTGSLLLDVGHLRDGLHTLNMQLGEGTAAELRNYIFYKTTIVEQHVFSMHYDCWFDQDYAARQSGTLGTGSLLLDVGHLRDGLHTLNMQLGDGAAAELRNYIFYKHTLQEQLADSSTLRYYYAIDGNQREPIEANPTNGLIHLDLDVNDITVGLHTINSFLMTDDGSSSSLYSSFFYKAPNGGNGIMRYEYWYNENWEARSTVDVPVQDTLQLITLLPVDSLPIRSNCFEFDPNGGSPVIYAKNDITFRFWNSEQRFTEATRQYVDERIAQVVVADTIERDTTKVIAAPTGNAIHWFKLAAGPGDSLSFKTDRRCTMQLYAPSGEMVYHASGDSVLTWDGCHAWENGVYYLAIHDAEGSGNIAVSYQWIYKYAVLAQNVNVVGNAHQSIITIDGNGFDSLLAIGLFNAIEDTLWSQYFYAETNNSVRAIFQFDSMPTGYYNIFLRYTDEIITVPNGLSIVPAFEGELISSLDYSETTSRDTLSYKLSVVNTGNISALGVPIVFHFKTPVNKVSRPRLYFFTKSSDGKKRQVTPNSINNPFYQGLSPDEANELRQWIDEYFADDLLLNKHLDDNGNEIRENTFFVDIPPLSTLEIDFKAPHTLSAHQSAEIDYYIPKYNRYQYDSIAASESEEDVHPSHWCEHHEKYECVANAIGIGLTAAGVTSWAGLAISWATTLSSTITKKICHQDVELDDVLSAGHLVMEADLVMVSAIVPTGADLLTNSSDNLEAWKGGLGLAGNLLTAYQCIKAFWPSRERHHHGQTEHVVPSDPNDIIGYLAESGSLFMGESQSNINYIIEFENDSSVASSMAHRVVIVDTLDGNVFDLNSFSATSFTLADEVVSINGGQQFVRTMDMRPEIDVIAQVELDYTIDSGIAVATWTFSSLDPMTLQPSASDTLGFLAIGGSGDVQFIINRKDDLADSTVIANRAWIKFDNEESIATSTWMNVIDNIPPVSSIDSILYNGDTTTVFVSATDNLSGVWRYSVYAQIGDEVLLPVALNVDADTSASFVQPDGTVMLYSSATDSAGNVERVAIAQPVVYDTTYISACDNYTWFDSIYTISGEYLRTKTHTVAGKADSVWILNLTIYPSNTSTENENVCDSYSWHGTTYTTSTVAYDTIANLNGCDSICTLNLTVRHSTTGDTAATTCDAFQWYGQTYAVSGNYPHLLSNSVGCDSTLTMALTVNYSSTGSETHVVCDSMTWHGILFNQSGTYSDTLTNSVACDSVVTLNLTVNPTYHHTDAVFACDNHLPYLYQDSALTVAGVHEVVFQSAQNCDSIVSVTLTVGATYQHDNALTLCQSGMPYTYGERTFTPDDASGEYVVPFTTTEGCDSIVTLDLTVHESEATEIYVVTVQNTYNVVVWERDAAVEHYNIYRESSTMGSYSLMAEVPYDATNEWVDSTSDTRARSYRYRISSTDSCGVESELSDIHRTMHLTISQGINGSWNLVWTEYEGTMYSTYRIYRGNSYNNLTMIDEIPAANTTYIDEEAPAGDVYYQVGVMMTTPCTPVSTKDSCISRSNVATNGEVGIADIVTEGVQIYVEGSLVVVRLDNMQGQASAEAVLYDMMGRRIASATFSDGEARIAAPSNGVYLVKVGNLPAKKVVVIR